jgi:hypothetical protein
MLHQKISLIKFFSWFLFVLEITYLFLMFFHTENAMTQDLGRHLLLGKMIVIEGRIPSTNTFSYTNPGFEFINHHWGSEVVFYVIWKMFALDGLIIFKTVSIISLIFLLSFYSIKKTGIFNVVLVLFPIIGLFTERTDTRPEIFGYIFLTLTLLILYKESNKKGKSVWLLPFITLLWVNTHISFVFCPLIYVFFIITALINKRIHLSHLVIGGLILIALLINPNGIKGALYPLEIFNNYGYTVVENQTPFFLQTVINFTSIKYFYILSALMVFAGLLMIYKKRYFEFLVTVMLCIMSFKAVRNFPFFAISAIYPLSFGLTDFSNLFNLKFKYKNGWLTLIQLIVIGIVWCATILNTVFFATNGYYKSRFSPVRTGTGEVKGMEKTVDYFITKKMTGPIFNNFDIGSYLIFRLYPQEKVFVDGRPEAYPSDFFQKTYIPMQEHEAIWNQQDDVYHFNTVMVSHTDMTPWFQKFIGWISKNDIWGIVYFDDFGLILSKKNGSGRLIVDSDLIAKRANELLSESYEPDQIARYINLFSLLGRRDLVNLGQFRFKALTK